MDKLHLSTSLAYNIFVFTFRTVQHGGTVHPVYLLNTKEYSSCYGSKDTQQRGKFGENFSIFRTVNFHPQSEICFSFQVKIPLTRNLFKEGIKPYFAIWGSSNAGELGIWEKFEF